MSTKIRIRFNKHRFLTLKPPFLAYKTAAFSIKNHRFLREKARNEAVFSSCRSSKTWFYVMLTWQIINLGFLFHEKPRK